MDTTTTGNDESPNAALLRSAKVGFDHLFSNDILEAKKHFTGIDEPFHLLGLGVCAFLEAALGMESGLMTEAARCLSLSEAGSRKKLKSGNGGRAGVGARVVSRFPPGLEWEILVADAVVMLGLTHALSESYTGYLQCMYSLNNAHSKFTKLYKTVFPLGLDKYKTPASSPSPSPGPTRKSSSRSLRSESSFSISSSTSNNSSATTTGAPANTSNTKPRPSFFGRWTGGRTLTVPVLHNDPTPSLVSVDATNREIVEDGSVDELIVAGTAFGYGLFNLVFSLMPKKIQSVVGFFGFKHDRRLALQALAVSAEKKDVHSVFAGLVLMTYHGVVLLLSGYQADEMHIIKRYKAIVDSITTRYPQGALWILNRAKILRMSHDADGAIRVLQEGLKPERPHSFAQADMLLVFELAWTLLGQCRYQEAADMFMRITELNSWSHATYHFLAAGCYISLGNLAKAQGLLNIIPDLMNKKLSGKDLPTEVLIKKKLEFYKEKQRRRGGDEKMYAQAIKISIAEELSIFWNTHARVDKSIAQTHIEEWSALTPPLSVHAPSASAFNEPNPSINYTENPPSDLDTTDELALRSLLLGISYRTTGEFASSRTYLKDAYARQVAIRVSTWIPGVAMFEMAVLDLKVVEARERRARALVSEDETKGAADIEGAAGRKTAAVAGGWEGTGKGEWERALTTAGEKLDVALSLATSSVDLSSRLDSRITMLRDEIAAKREMLGIV